ncbi:U-box domain-containing protein 44-like [Pyrus ussuriensis x Pyrus communis]|uniref:U-box domain-containing protein 44-like n=1 Tax=Pyrus ussuriensis x Pyrus communis TaxID=2448454 RepID=A0A5N5EXZ6_9ROSA|nr:U-box domain-containing protein 44-like [Pyrus ussuriensis x Pyrus communis]
MLSCSLRTQPPSRSPPWCPPRLTEAERFEGLELKVVSKAGEATGEVEESGSSDRRREDGMGRI